jgi:hypothetical protein
MTRTMQTALICAVFGAGIIVGMLALSVMPFRAAPAPIPSAQAASPGLPFVTDAMKGGCSKSFADEGAEAVTQCELRLADRERSLDEAYRMKQAQQDTDLGAPSAVEGDPVWAAKLGRCTKSSGGKAKALDACMAAR